MEEKIRYIKSHEIKPAPFNPSIRTDEKSLRVLYDSMRRKGFLPHHPVILVAGNVLADGHRRWTCAKMLNITDIPYIVANESLDEVWAENGSQRAVTEKEMMQALRDGLDVIPDGKQKRIEKVVNSVGKDGLKFLADNNLGPNTIDLSQRVAKYVGRMGDSDFVKQVMYWLAHYKCQDEVKYLIRHGIPASVLEEKVYRNEKIKMWEES